MADGTQPAATESQVLAGWLYKLSAGRVKTYKWRWFVFDPYTGYLNFFKSKAPNAAASGYIDMAACRSIETTDPELKRFVLNLPSRQITLMSSGPEETIYWMEELLDRKSQLKQRAEDESKDEDFPDWEVIPTTALDDPGAVMGVLDGPLSPLTPPRLPNDGSGANGDGDGDGIAAGTAAAEMGSPGMAGHSMRSAQQRLAAGDISQAEYDHLKAVLTRPDPIGAAGDGASTTNTHANGPPRFTLGELTEHIRSPPPAAGDGAPAAAAPSTERHAGGTAGGTVSEAAMAEAVKSAVEAAEEAVKARMTVQISAANEELGGRDEAICLLEEEVVDMDRELTLKDKAIELLQRQLRAEQEARREEAKFGVTFAELQGRLVKSQTELAHTKAVLDLQNHRIAAAMHQVTYYKSVVDGSARSKKKEQALLMEQLVAQDQQLQVSEDTIHRLTQDSTSA